MTITIKTPHINSFFNDSAKKRGAHYSSDGWVFNDADQPVIDKMLEKYFGILPDGATNQVTLKIEFLQCESERCSALEIAGRRIATAFGRDTGARLANDVVILSGKIASGGSAKNWETVARAGTVCLVRNFSKMLADALLLESNEKIRYSIVDEKAEAESISFDDI